MQAKCKHLAARWLLATGSLLLFAGSATAMSVYPACRSPTSDSDGDGYGWENNGSCAVHSNDDQHSSSSSDNVADISDATSGDEHPHCAGAGADSDGDGYGWENNQSCLIASPSASQSGSQSTPDSDNAVSQNGMSNDGKPLCSGNAEDSDGDGYGWESGSSCVIPDSTAAIVPPHNGNPSCSSALTDEDGDGWGWENAGSCIFASTAASPTDTEGSDSGNDDSGSGEAANDASADSGSNDNDSTDNQQSDTTPAPLNPRPADITDLVLVAGQSNTLGSGTSTDATLDAPTKRVFAFTRNGWQVAALWQKWDQGAHPGNGNPDSNYHNNFALHFGKRLAARDPSRVVGIILTSQPGEGIAHWDRGNQGYRLVQQKVIAAINELPHKSRIDGLLWHQGETDWQLYGTSDPDARQPAPNNYYPQRLAALIANLRGENWYHDGLPFICGETIRATGVNTHLMALNNDNDSNTACVAGAGLPSRSPGGAHFNAEALRTIGGRYADQYYTMTR